MNSIKKNQKISARKSGKKWLISSIAVATVVFGPPNLIGSAEIIHNTLLQSQNQPNNNTSSEKPDNITEQVKNTDSDKSISTDNESDSSKVTSKMSGLTLDMDPSTPNIDNSIIYNLSSDGIGWPSSSSNTSSISVSATVAAGDTIKITIPKGITVQAYDTPNGATVNKVTVNEVTELTYTFTVPGVNSFNISYFFSDQGDNKQFSPGKTVLPVSVEGGGTTLNASIIADNQINNTFTVRTHNTAVANNIYTADGNSVYNFVLGIKTTPDFTDASVGVTQPKHAKTSGVIHVPSGFVLTGGQVGNYFDTNENAPVDGSVTNQIPKGLSQPGGAGTDIIVSDVVGGGYAGFNEAYMYLYGYFATGTPDGIYHFTPDLTITPQYFDGTTGSTIVTNGSIADITLGNANPGVMTPMFGGVLEGYDANSIDPNHEGFYSKTISDNTGLTGFLTGKEFNTSINNHLATPNLSINFLDNTVNQTNELKDYKFTLPKNWCGNLKDVSFSTGPNGSVPTTGNLNSIGSFTIFLDNGASYVVSTIASNDEAITNALLKGAHIVSISGQAKILAGNNIDVRLLNAVIEDNTYKNGDSVPIQLDVHSDTSDTNGSVTGHLKYFDDSVNSSTQFSLKNTLDYDISGTYTQGQTFTTGERWTLLNSETTLSEDSTGKIIIPGTNITGTTAIVKLPTIVISSVDKGMIDLDQSKLAQWGWDYEGTKYYPIITDLGIDTNTGEHLTKLDFSHNSVTIPGDKNPNGAFFYPDALPWRVSNSAAPTSGVTTHWITQLTDNNKDTLHPTYGGKVYDGSTGMNWKITAPAIVSSSVGISGNKTGDSIYFTEATGMAGFDRGLKTNSKDDNNSGKVMLSITNGSNSEYNNAQTIAVLPNISNGDDFTVELTGPITNTSTNESQVLYSTKSFLLPANDSDTAIDLTTNDWIDEGQVTDWSSIHSVAIKSDKLTLQNVISGYLPIKVSQIETAKIGNTAKVESYSYAKGSTSGSDLSTNTPMKAQIYGIPQITVHYEETSDGLTSNGTVLAPSEKLIGKDTNGEVYENYNSKQKDITGYSFKSLSTNSAAETGYLTDDTSDITYLYTKDNMVGGEVIVKYVDETGKEISEHVTKTGDIGSDYITDKKVIKGYTFKKIEGNPTGKFTSEAQTVIYVYTKDDGGSSVIPDPDPNDTSQSKSDSKNTGSSDNHDSEQKLPQTGDETTPVFNLIFAIMLLSIGSFLTILKRKQKD